LANITKDGQTLGQEERVELRLLRQACDVLEVLSTVRRMRIRFRQSPRGLVMTVFGE
jgi:hypothetical protein